MGVTVDFCLMAHVRMIMRPMLAGVIVRVGRGLSGIVEMLVLVNMFVCRGLYMCVGVFLVPVPSRRQTTGGRTEL
jgi:hypothetical protein